MTNLEPLRKKAIELTSDNIIKHFAQIVEVGVELIKKLDENPSWKGLSAIQLGVCLPVFAMRFDRTVEVCINPKIDLSRVMSLQTKPETSLSFTGMICKVERPMSLSVEYLVLNHKGIPKVKRRTLSGINARTFDTLIDNLNGWVFLDKAKPLEDKGQLKEYLKIYRILSGTYIYDYFLEKQNVLFFSGLEIDPKSVPLAQWIGISTEDENVEETKSEEFFIGSKKSGGDSAL